MNPPPAAPSRPSVRPRPYRILVVASDPVLTAALSTALEEDGYAVRVASDGLAATMAFGEEKADLVLADLSPRPEETLDLVRRLQTLHPHLPVVLLAPEERTSVETALGALRHGARDLLLRPLDPAAVRESVHRALDVRTLVREEEEVRTCARRRLSIAIPSREDLVGGIVFEAVHLARGFFTSKTDLEVRLPLLISEACYNAIEHGNARDRSKTVRFEMEVSTEGLVLSVEDDGEGFTPAPPEAAAAAPPDHSPRGRGLLLMRLYADRVDFEKGGRRIVLRLAANGTR